MKSIYAQILYTNILLMCAVGSCVGSSGKNDSQKIAYGDFASIKEVPYVVRLAVFNIGFCTGAIIHEFWVLTAGHCLQEYSIFEMKVIAGMDDDCKCFLRNEGIQIRVVDESVIHPKYVPKEEMNGNDIGLIKVQNAFILSPKVDILKLSDDIWPQENRYFRECTTAGWGLSAGNKQTYRLKKLDIRARHGYEGCKCFWRMNQALVCTGETRSVCPGDSGSALNCDGKGVGVASFLYLEETQCKPVFFDSTREIICGQKTYAAYTYICPHLNWISRYVPDVPGTPMSCKATPSACPSNYILILVFMPLIKLCPH